MSQGKERPSCEGDSDGFGVTYLCRATNRDCVHGSCWHMDRVRMMVRRWFSTLGPREGSAGYWVRREDPTIELTTAQAKERMAAYQEQATRCAELHRSRYPQSYDGDGQPRKFKDPWKNGIGYTPFPDVDGVGDWGKHVRQWEDREDER